MKDHFPAVDLEEVIEAVSWIPPETSYYLERTTGVIFPICHDEGISGEYTPEEQEMIRRIEDEDPLILRLPDQYEIDEYDMMRTFVLEREDEAERRELQRAIHGRGAFRYFKDTVHRLGIQDEWYRERDRAYRQRAIDWCEYNDVRWVETDPPPSEE